MRRKRSDCGDRYGDGKHSGLSLGCSAGTDCSAGRIVVKMRKCECACNGAGNGNCDAPTDVEKKNNEANKKEGEAENENNRKGSEYDRDI
jgi:hypothetical protein